MVAGTNVVTMSRPEGQHVVAVVGGTDHIVVVVVVVVPSRKVVEAEEGNLLDMNLVADQDQTFPLLRAYTSFDYYNNLVHNRLPLLGSVNPP